MKNMKSRRGRLQKREIEVPKRIFTRRRRLQFEHLEERQMLFASAQTLFAGLPILTVGQPIHENITEEAIGFLKGDVLSRINASQESQDNILSSTQYIAANHFDGSHFSDGVATINSNYT